MLSNFFKSENKDSKLAIREKAANLILVASFLILSHFSYFYFFTLIWVSFVPVIILILRNKSASCIFYLFFSSFLIAWEYASFLLRIKIGDFSYKYFIEAYIFTAFIFFTAFLLYWFLLRKIKYPYSLFLLPALWLLVIIICNLIPGGLSWFEFSRLQPMLFPLSWLLGAKGITFLIMLVNSLIAFWFIYRDRKILYSLVAIFFILLACFLYSYLARPSGEKIKVALIQGNITNDWSWRVANAKNNVIDKYEKLTVEAAKSHPDIIIWPEYSIPNDIMYDKSLYDRISSLAKDVNAYLVFGSLGKTEQTDPEYNYIKNITYVFSNKGDYLGEYTAVFPLTFIEKVIAGKDFPVFDAGFGKFGINSCHDEEFSFVNNNYAGLGADFFITISNDYPIGSQKIIKLKSMHSEFSASENHKYVLRVANTGYTEVINPYGKVVASLEPNKEGVLITDIYIK